MDTQHTCLWTMDTNICTHAQGLWTHTLKEGRSKERQMVEFELYNNCISYEKSISMHQVRHFDGIEDKHLEIEHSHLLTSDALQIDQESDLLPVCIF